MSRSNPIRSAIGDTAGKPRSAANLPLVAAAPLRFVEGRALRASEPPTSPLRREPVAAAPEPRVVRVVRALGRLMGLPRVVRSAATGLRPTVGTRPARPVAARPVAARSDAVAREPPVRAVALVQADPVKLIQTWLTELPPSLAAASLCLGKEVLHVDAGYRVMGV